VYHIEPESLSVTVDVVDGIAGVTSGMVVVWRTTTLAIAAADML
jgi:hypothetical protein